MLKRTILIGAAVLALAVGGCGSDDGDGNGGGEVTVSAASSLTDAFQAYGDEFGDVKLSFAGSDELAAQIKQGARPDVFASANRTYPDELASDGLLEKPVTFARNELVIAVPSDSDIDSVDDLTKPGVDLVIGAEGVPIGDYTRDVIGKLPPAEGKAILANVRSEESDVKAVLGKVAQSAADAGFVYTTDVTAAGDDVREVKLPAELEPLVSYGVAVVKDAPNPDGAQEFIDGLLDGEGAQALADAGFLPPE